MSTDITVTMEFDLDNQDLDPAEIQFQRKVALELGKDPKAQSTTAMTSGAKRKKSKRSKGRPCCEAKVGHPLYANEAVREPT